VRDIGSRMLDEAEGLREVVLSRAATWKQTLLEYIQRASQLYAPRTS
jgi:hypothetical protein